MDLCFWQVITMWTNFLWKNCYPTNYGKFPGKYQILGISLKLQGCNADKIGQNSVAYVCLKISTFKNLNRRVFRHLSNFYGGASLREKVTV